MLFYLSAYWFSLYYLISLSILYKCILGYILGAPPNIRRNIRLHPISTTVKETYFIRLIIFFLFLLFFFVFQIKFIDIG